MKASYIMPRPASPPLSWARQALPAYLCGGAARERVEKRGLAHVRQPHDALPRRGRGYDIVLMIIIMVAPDRWLSSVRTALSFMDSWNPDDSGRLGAVLAPHGISGRTHAEPTRAPRLSIPTAKGGSSRVCLHSRPWTARPSIQASPQGGSR
jgi:hypothetical protein